MSLPGGTVVLYCSAICEVLVVVSLPKQFPLSTQHGASCTTVPSGP